METHLKLNDLINISKSIPDVNIYELGVNLEFNNTEVEAFQKENERNLLNMEGTFEMLRSWTEKDGSLEKFIEALIKTGLVDLADQIQLQTGKTGQMKEIKQGPSGLADIKRDLPAQDLPARNLPPAQPAQPTQPAQPAQPAQLGDDGGIDDETLRKLGKRLFTGVDELSSALGVQYAALKKYKAMNYQTGEVTADGTITMLFDWREKLAPSEQRAKLGQALQKARLIRVKEEYNL